MNTNQGRHLRGTWGTVARSLPKEKEKKIKERKKEKRDKMETK